MKIDLAIVSYEKDAPQKGAGNGGAERGAMGDAFGKAVRDAEGNRPAPTKDKPRAGAETVAADEGDKAASVTDADTAADADEPVATEADPLQSLLGALAAGPAVKAVSGKDAAQAQSQAEKGEGAQTPSVPDPKLDGSLVAEELTVKDKRPVQLDVLRMETHFEPRQDGMVLVEGAAAGGKPSEPGAIDLKTRAAASRSEGPASALADLAKPKAADAVAKPMPDKAPASDDASLPPMRFDEALAQLGRGGGDRSGDDSRRDRGASPLAEIAARRAAAKGAEPVSTITGPQPGPSPYNLAAQVAGPIMDALGEPGKAASQPSSASSDAHLRMRAGGGALKTLTIQLHPEHLGTVDVSLRLNEGRLTLELAASRSDTASMLLDDQASLRKLLEHAGFSLDDAAISVITRDSGQLRAAESGTTGGQQRDPSNGGGGEGRSEARAQSGGSDDQQPRRRPAPQAREDRSASPARSGATYL
ncbi:flagellar hook-length control protein FliK [Aureimonas sp. SK2]|uniref:flagellar hook-length control protein FliK n=1 Tax=Aureimonas sp. SK2 TaxID=3015992 RepID=UPI0024451276|nr:flagellar hook-length control protein FliK [Aureimonas sp. SK2]